MTENAVPEHETYRLRWHWARFVASRKGISGPSKVAAFALASSINKKEGIAWPSHATLALCCGVSERQVQDNLVPLVKNKLLDIFNRGGGRGRSCAYRPLLVKEAVAFDEMMKGLPKIAREKRSEAISSFEESLKLGSALPSIVSGNSELQGAKLGTVGSKLGTVGCNTRKRTAEDLSTYLSKTTIDLNADEESSREAFKRLVESLPDNQQWPEGNVPKAKDQEHARRVVAKASVRLLGYDTDLRDPPRIGDIHADAFVMAQFPPQALVEILTLCTQGRLRRADLARALAALGIPNATQSSEGRASGAL
jgi:hypothetical protein